MPHAFTMIMSVTAAFTEGDGVLLLKGSKVLVIIGCGFGSQSNQSFCMHGIISIVPFFGSLLRMYVRKR